MRLSVPFLTNSLTERHSRLAVCDLAGTRDLSTDHAGPQSSAPRTWVMRRLRLLRTLHGSPLLAWQLT